MNKTKRKKFGRVASVVGLAILLVCAILWTGSARHNAVRPTERAGQTALRTPASVDALVASSYPIGARFTVPSGRITADGQTVDATESVLVYPSGVAYAGTVFTLDEAGSYTVIYSAFTARGKVSASRTFTVNRKNYEVSSSVSSVRYGELDMSKMPHADGLVVTLADGDAFRYNVPLDLRTRSLGEIIKLYPGNATASAKEAYDADYYIVRLTDCYDPQVYVEMKLYFLRGTWAYFRAGGSNQTDVGLSDQEDAGRYPRTVNVDGTYYYPHRGRYGVLARGWNSGGGGYTWMYDREQMRVYIGETRSGTSSVTLVNVLNHTDLYGDDVFPDFTTGEVYLSVYASDYNNATAEIQIESIFGVSGRDLDLGDTSDGSLPEITLDTVRTDANGVYAACGEPFDLTRHTATASDVHLAGGVRTAVYYNYGTEWQRSVRIENGKFTPANEGTYTVVFSAKDTSGNVGRAYLTVNSIKTQSGKGIDLTVDEIGSMQTGHTTVLPVHTVAGINRAVEMDITATVNGNVTQIDPQTRTFVPLYAGTYTIEYSYHDNVYAYRHSYTVACTQSDATVFTDKFVLPRYFIKNASYTIEDIPAYTFENGMPTARKADLYVRFDGGAYTAANAAATKITGNESVQFRFEKNGASVESDPMPIADVGFGDRLRLADYFDAVSGNAATGTSFVRLSATNDDAVHAKFINALSLDSFLFRFSVPVGFDGFTAVRVVLTDYYDPAVRAEIAYTQTSDGIRYSVNGGRAYNSLGRSFADSEIVYFSYNGDTNGFQNSFGDSAACDTQFSSDLVLMDIYLEGVTGSAGIDIRQIANQSFANTTVDRMEPNVTVRQSGGVHSLGSTVTVFAAQASDVLTPVLRHDITVSVTAPNGDFLTSADGVLLGAADCSRNYEITLASFGVYQVTYRCSDQNGRVKTVSYNISVIDETPPSVSFAVPADEEQTAKVGQTVRIAALTATDDISSADKLEITVLVYDGNGAPAAMNCTEFVPARAGQYTVYAQCTDEAGNTAYASYRICVR